MGWFRRILGGHDVPPVDPEADAFDAQWPRERHRFGIITGLGDTRWDLTDPETGEPLPPHEGLNATFDEWRGRTTYNQRKIFFDLLANSLRSALEPWQAANYLTTVRQPDDALRELQAGYGADLAEETTADVAYAFAYALLGRTSYDEALPWAQHAACRRVDNRTRAMHADALHLCGRQREAHAIYEELMGDASRSSKDVDAMFADVFALESGSVPSAVFALGMLESMESEAQQRFLELAEPEFYWSPYFCMHHAYALARSGDPVRCAGKLVGIVRDMPWVKEASLNALSILGQLDPERTSTVEECTLLENNIAEHGWTADGMQLHRIEVSS